MKPKKTLKVIAVYVMVVASPTYFLNGSLLPIPFEEDPRKTFIGLSCRKVKIPPIYLYKVM